MLTVPRRHLGGRRAAVLVAGAVLVLALAGCGAAAPAASSTVTTTSVPDAVPPAHMSVQSESSGPVCVVTERPYEPVEPIKQLRDNPVAVNAVWLPGPGDSAYCHSGVGQLDGAGAVTILDAIKDAPAAPRGVASCPADNGRAVDLVFQYPGTLSEANVSVGLSGCQLIHLPDGTTKRLTKGLAYDLDFLNPPPGYNAPPP